MYVATGNISRVFSVTDASQEESRVSSSFQQDSEVSRDVSKLDTAESMECSTVENRVDA